MELYNLSSNEELSNLKSLNNNNITHPKKQYKFITTSIDIQTINAFDADEIGYGAKCLVAACLPYRNPKPEQLINGCWTRTNGNYSLYVQGGPEGIPYGSYPRLFTIWLTTEAKITSSRYISLGHSFKGFCRTLNLDCSRGKNGAGKRLIEQINRFLSSRISFTKIEKSKNNLFKAKREFIPFSDEYELIWGHEHSNNTSLKEANIVLSEAFFNEITTHHIPLDLRAIISLKQFSQALDIYQWLAYRNFQLNNSSRKKAFISWEQLNAQFGSNYNFLGQFKTEFINTLKCVLTVYTDAKVEIYPDKLALIASPTPITSLQSSR